VKILVIDHSKVFRALWDRMVIKAGHEPIMVATGSEGLSVLNQRQVDLVCVSLTLPDFDGIEFCRRVRKLARQNKLPVILLTSTEDKHARQEAFEAGITEIHPKTNIQDLFNQAARFIERDRREVSGRVLYVEDSSVVAHVMLRILKGMGLEVEHFRSASAALGAFEESSFDLIISDILVEGEMSGMGLVSRVRQMDPDRSRIPILAVSGMDDSSRRIELFRLGVNDFISKPVVEEEVVARVTNLITNKQLFDKVQNQQRHLYELAMTDQLTGLYNRNSLSEFAHKAFSQANRHNFPLSLILIDIDNFKTVNDTRGHLTGDAVLEEIGGMLKHDCRDEDFAVRFGGEELMLILPHCNFDDALRRAEGIRQKISELHPAKVAITASLGVTSRPLDREITMEDLFRIADKAVYSAKKAGKNRVVGLEAEGELPGGPVLSGSGTG
jgi:two-component system, cell cycle response regulator